LPLIIATIMPMIVTVSPKVSENFSVIVFLPWNR
jgi:hypothetical protein